MPRRILLFDPPDRFVVGTVGIPGQRTFFLQARGADRLVSVVVEKIQVAALADRLRLLLAELGRRGIALPGGSAEAPTDDGPLDEPVEEAFRVGTLALAWDPGAEEIIVEARAVTDDAGSEEEAPEDVDDDDPDGPDIVRVRLTAAMTLAFIGRAERTVAAGRPPCPWCGQPLDPHGHFCPRRNGGRAN